MKSQTHYFKFAPRKTPIYFTDGGKEKKSRDHLKCRKSQGNPNTRLLKPVPGMNGWFFEFTNKEQPVIVQTPENL